MNDKSHIVESSAATDVVQDSYESMATILSPVEEPEPEKMKRICTLLAVKKTLINLKLMSLMMHYMSISLEMIAVLNQITVMVRMLIACCKYKANSNGFKFAADGKGLHFSLVSYLRIRMNSGILSK